jgi:hypothetical protein
MLVDVTDLALNRFYWALRVPEAWSKSGEVGDV